MYIYIHTNVNIYDYTYTCIHVHEAFPLINLSSSEKRGAVKGWQKHVSLPPTPPTPHDPILDSNLTVLDAVLAAYTPVMNAVRNYERALVKQAAMLRWGG